MLAALPPSLFPPSTVGKAQKHRSGAAEVSSVPSRNSIPEKDTVASSPPFTLPHAVTMTGMKPLPRTGAASSSSHRPAAAAAVSFFFFLFPHFNFSM